MATLGNRDKEIYVVARPVECFSGSKSRMVAT